MRLLILGLCVIVSACGPDCVKGHDEVRVIEAHTTEDYVPIHMGDIVIPNYVQTYHPARTVTVFVCDEYEKRK